MFFFLLLAFSYLIIEILVCHATLMMLSPFLKFDITWNPECLVDDDDGDNDNVNDNEDVSIAEL